VELSPWGLFFRQRYCSFLLTKLNTNLKKLSSSSLPHEELLKHPSIKAIKLKFSIPYEFQGPLGYSRETGAHISLIDSSLFSKKQTDKWMELVESGNLRILLEQDGKSLESECRRQYRMAREIIGKTCPPHPVFMKSLFSEDRTWEERELWLVKQIKLCIQHFSFKKIAIIVGWKHLATSSDRENLASPFRSMNIRLVLLSNPFFYPPTSMMNRGLSSEHVMTW